MSDVDRQDGVRTGWGTHRLKIVDIVDGEILRDVKQKIVREGIERHEERDVVDGRGWTWIGDSCGRG